MAPKYFLDNLTVLSPCTADWDSMVGGDDVRFCRHCSLKVHNISQMTRNQAQRLINRSDGRLCVRYYRTPDGNVVTQSPATKLHLIGRRVSRLAAGAFTATLSVTGAVGQSSQNCQSNNCNRPGFSQADARWALGASVFGTVADQNGAVVLGASVALWNEHNNFALYTASDSTGLFRFEGLEPGLYNLRIEAPGFAPDQLDGFYLRPNEETRLDRTLSVAGLEEEVEIKGEGVALAGAVAFVAPESPFVRAAQEDNLETLLSLIAGTDVNQRDKRSGTTALEHAVRNANREMVQLLLGANADVNARNRSGMTPLMMLDGDATSDLVWDLINFGANVNLEDQSGSTALMEAAQSNNIEIMKTLLEAGAKVDSKNRQSQTALMLAAADGDVNMVRALILAGADFNVRDNDGKNALAHAAENDHFVVVRFLKSKGAVETVDPVVAEVNSP